MTMSNHRKVIRSVLILYEILGVSVLFGVYLWAGIWTWTEATISGILTGNYSTTVYTNLFGENSLELIMLLVFLPAVLRIFVRMLQVLGQDFRK